MNNFIIMVTAITANFGNVPYTTEITARFSNMDQCMSAAKEVKRQEGVRVWCTYKTVDPHKQAINRLSNKINKAFDQILVPPPAENQKEVK